MTDKERLEEIERLRGIDRRLIAFGHTDWLIEQVKRVQDYKTAYEIVDMLARSTIEKANELDQQNKRYREALEFYAEQDNYGWEISYRPQQEIDCMVIDDGGHTARKALGGES